MTKEQTRKKLQDDYDYYCFSIEVGCDAIMIGRNIEYNRKQNEIAQERIRAIRKEAEEKGIELLPFRRENNPYCPYCY